MRTVLEEIKYFCEKRFTTLSGTLVYFLLMSVAPFLFWLAILVGDVDLSRFFSQEPLVAIAPVVNYLQSAAANATGGAGIILAITSLWSSTNFFYHLRRSGEMIYAPEIHKSGLKLRLFSLIAVFATLFVVAFGTALPFLGLDALVEIMPVPVAEAITAVFFSMFAFFAAYFLNVFACPVRLAFDQAAGGALLTVVLWLACSLGFSIYLRYANPQKLYGAIAAIIVFLLWCYLMINSLVLGIMYNGKRYHNANSSLSRGCRVRKK